MSEFKEVWYVWDGEGEIPKGVKKAICQCDVLIDDEKYFDSIDSAWDWQGAQPFIQAYTLCQKRRRVECDNCQGKGFRVSGGVSSGGIIMGHKINCHECNGTGFKKGEWEYAE